MQAAGNLAACIFLSPHNPSIMIYFLWSLLNLGALIWFLFISFSVLKTVRENMGILSAVIFIVCCLSFIKFSVSNKQSELAKNPEAKDQVIVMQNLKNELFFNLDLLYADGNDTVKTDGSYATTIKSGFVIGHEWFPTRTKVLLKDGSRQFEADGIHEWRFLGLTLHSAPETYKGTIDIK